MSTPATVRISPIVAPAGSLNHCSSPNMIFCAVSSRRDGISTGRSPASSDSSAARAVRLAERTEENVATASTSVPPAVASEEIVTQSRDTRRA